MVIFASVVTYLTAFMALYYGIQQSENVKLFAIPYFLTVLHAHLLPSSKPFKTYHAFGYDQYSNDYKVARIVTYQLSQARYIYPNFILQRLPQFFHVYSLNADSWTQIIDTTIHHSNIRLFSRFNGFYFNGVHYWRFP